MSSWQWFIRPCWNLRWTHKKPAADICSCCLSHILRTANCDNMQTMIRAICDLMWNSEWHILTIQWTSQQCLRERDKGFGANQWYLPTRVNWSIWIAHKGQLSLKPPLPPPSHHPLSGQSQVITPPPPYPHQMCQLTESTRETFTGGRREHPLLSLKLSDT